MPDLHTAADRQQIRDGLRDTMDSFSRTPVILRKIGISMSRYNEDRTDGTPTDYSFTAIVTYGKNDVQEDGNLSGKTNFATVEVAVKMTILEGLGLLVDDMPNINPATDLLIINGQIFDITFVSPQGQIDKKQTKANIKGRLKTAYFDSNNM